MLKSALCVAFILATGATTLPALAATAPECKADAPLDLRIKAALARTDRPADQQALDANRASEVNFVLSHIKPGDHVLDLGAGRGYSSMVLSAAVCDGSVDSQNPPQWDEKAVAARQALAQARANIHLITTDFDKVPAPTKPYDAIFLGTIYHDTYNEPNHNAVALDTSLKGLLKPGGLVILTDHRTADGHGATETSTLHRIEKATVIADFKAAGFELVEDSPALANPADDHSLKIFDPAIRGHTDRMALVFRKPN